MLKPGMLEKGASGMVIGAIAGASYGLLRGFMSQPGYVDKLQPRPECFDVDAKAPKLFYDLASYRYAGEEQYAEALHNVDALFCLEKQLQLGEVKPDITDPPTATQYGVRALTHLRTLRDAIHEEGVYEELSALIRALEQIIENHLGNIELLCRNA